MIEMRHYMDLRKDLEELMHMLAQLRFGMSGISMMGIQYSQGSFSDSLSGIMEPQEPCQINVEQYNITVLQVNPQEISDLVHAAPAVRGGKNEKAQYSAFAQPVRKAQSYEKSVPSLEHLAHAHPANVKQHANTKSAKHSYAKSLSQKPAKHAYANAKAQPAIKHAYAQSAKVAKPAQAYVNAKAKRAYAKAAKAALPAQAYANAKTQKAYANAKALAKPELKHAYANSAAKPNLTKIVEQAKPAEVSKTRIPYSSITAKKDPYKFKSRATPAKITRYAQPQNHYKKLADKIKRAKQTPYRAPKLRALPTHPSQQKSDSQLTLENVVRENPTKPKKAINPYMKLSSYNPGQNAPYGITKPSKPAYGNASNVIPVDFSRSKAYGGSKPTIITPISAGLKGYKGGSKASAKAA
ncbi:MAG: hypothetical protein ACE5FT_03375 [Candidatus Nanoarchaeia archaeon]